MGDGISSNYLMSKKLPKCASFSINVHLYLPGSMKAGLANLFLISPSGCRRNFANFYLITFPSSLFICLFVCLFFFRHYPQFSLIHKSQLFEISARLKLVSSPFSSLQFFIGHLEKFLGEYHALWPREQAFTSKNSWTRAKLQVRELLAGPGVKTGSMLVCRPYDCTSGNFTKTSVREKSREVYLQIG